MKRNRRYGRLAACAALVAATAGAHAATLTVTDTAGQSLATAKVREVAAAPKALDTSDNGYPAPGKVRRVDVRDHALHRRRRPRELARSRRCP